MQEEEKRKETESNHQLSEEYDQRLQLEESKISQKISEEVRDTNYSTHTLGVYLS